MGIAFVKSADAYASTVAFSGNVTAGNHVIVVGTSSATITAAARTAGTATVGAAVPVTQGAGTNVFVHMFVFPVTGTGTLTMGITASGDNGISLLEVSGLDNADLIEMEASTASQPTGKDPSVNITTTVADSLLVGGFCDEIGSSGTITAGNAPATWALFGNQAGHQHAAEYLILSATITNAACNLLTSGTPGTTSKLQVTAFNGTAGVGATIIPQVMHHRAQQGFH